MHYISSCMMIACVFSLSAADWSLDLPATKRMWIGPQTWATPIMNWSVSDGRIICAKSSAFCQVSLLTVDAASGDGDLRLSMRCGRSGDLQDSGVLGFRLGIRSGDPDVRARILMMNDGHLAGIDAAGVLHLNAERSEQTVPADNLRDLHLELQMTVHSRATATLTASDASGKLLAQVTSALQQVDGGLSLVYATPKAPKTTGTAFWLAEVSVGGSLAQVHPERRFGPILWSQYTVHDGEVKMVAQFPPLGEQDLRTAELRIASVQGAEQVVQAAIDPLSCVALFRMPGLDPTRATPYEVVYGDDHWKGTIRAEPVGDLRIASISCARDKAFPHTLGTAALTAQDPDMVFIAGDWIYEGNAGYGVPSKSDDPVRFVHGYLPKFWCLGWPLRDLLKDRPLVACTDDHDVFEDDLWGGGGPGFHLGASIVNAIETTQMGQLPDPVEPAEAGVLPRYTSLRWAGLDIALVESRKFKSGINDLKSLVPPGTPVEREFKHGTAYDPAAFDHDSLSLLGAKQEAWLCAWSSKAATWKVVMHGSPIGMVHSGYGDLAIDFDSNGWPASGRRRMLTALSGSGALLLSGDLHLGVLSQHGLQAFRDGPFELTSPAFCATSARVWNPGQPGQNREPESPENCGDFLDGFGNRLTMWAIADGPAHPVPIGMPASSLPKKSGYSMVILHRADRSMTVESWDVDCWPGHGEPAFRRRITPVIR